MARSENLLPSIEIKFMVNTQTGWYLDRLIEKGIYGNTRHEAARVALFDYCKLLIGQGKLAEAPAVPIGTAAVVVEPDAP